MTTQLYSADLMDVARPIKEKVKRVPKKKLPDSPPPTEISVEEPVAEPSLEVAASVAAESAPEPPKKKQKTEKQLAALERAKETRRLKKEAQVKEAETKKLIEEEKRLALQAKKEAQREKRRLARLVKKGETQEQLDAPALVIKGTRSRGPIKESEDPPAWFKKYVEGVKQEQSKLGNEKKPQRVIKEEATTEAKAHWENGPTRNRVTHEVDNHMQRMYSMIFGNRRAMGY